MRPLVIGAIAVVFVTLFGLLAVKSDTVTRADLGISKVLNELHTGVLGSITSALYEVFSPVPAIALTAVICGVIWLVTKQWRVAITFGFVVAATWIPSAVVKALVHRPRPDGSLLPHPFAVQPDASYPSGHTVFLTAIVVTAVLLSRGRPVRPLVTVLGCVFVALVAVSFVIDGVHYAGDVTASIIWAVGLAPAVLYLWNRFIIPLTYRGR